MRLHPRYLYLLKKKKLRSRIGMTSPVIKKNIFIVTSCINIHDNISYPIHNEKHTVSERFNETLVGLKSIRNNYSDCYILFLESSRISNLEKKHIEILIDEYFDYSEYNSIKLARKHFNKGVPQFTALVNFLEENRENYFADNFHFLGARYSLIDNITENKNPLPGAYFLYYPEHNNVSTRYFFISKITLSEMIKPFRKTLYCAIVGTSVEDFIDSFFPKNGYLSKLGIMGRVNGKDTIYE